MLRVWWLAFFLILSLHASDRCRHYIQDVRRAHYRVFGLNYPYWYGVGQLQQESNCRNVLSRDGVGSEGLPQITYRIWKKFLRKKGIPNIKTIRNQLLAQAYIMKNCKIQAYSSHLWVAYQLYNGGPLINKEITRARRFYGIREVPHEIAREFCIRKKVRFSNGQVIDACDINYEYSEKVYKYGQWYNITGAADDPYIFW